MAMRKKPMKKKGMARGGAMKKKGYAKGGAKMPMVKKGGKMIPAFAADGKGKMNKGGMTKKKKGMARGGAAMKKKKGMAKGGATMKKKGYAAGGMSVGQLRAAAKAKGYKIMKG